MTDRRKRDPAEAFWAKVDKGKGCWLWTAATLKGGYGQFRGRSAHRVSWEMAYGPIPKGLCVCHSCDNPPCVRPDHLFVGAHAANIMDKVRKGRGKYGPRPRGGSMRQRSPGAWELRASVGQGPDGKYRQVSRVFRGSEEDAREALNELVQWAVERHGHPLTRS